MRRVIGEGTYGCVLKPSVHCADAHMRKFNYDGYVSKVMSDNLADSELKEFLIMQKHDKKNEFHLGMPIKCKPKLDRTSTAEIGKCRSTYPNMRLLLMKDGGVNLEDFVQNIDAYLATDMQRQTDLFWVEVQHLLLGLKTLQEKKMVHNDLKPQNIVFHADTHSMKFIDFGLMSNAADIEYNCKRNQYLYGVSHWSFPPDSNYMNADHFKNRPVLVDGHKYYFFYRYGVYPANSFKTHETAFKQGIRAMNYSTFLKQAIKSIDVYGVGFTLHYLLRAFFIKRAIDAAFETSASRLFSSMCDWNSTTRVTDMNVILNRYEQLLSDHGFLTRLQKNIVRHRLVDMVHASTRNVPNLDRAQQQKANRDPRMCPPEKEINPATNRCVNKCPEGKHRNEKFKCVNKTVKAKCPPEKEINPATNRCVNKCPEGKHRNEKFKCVNKTVKAKCPPKKEINPATNRCVNKCPEGKHRNEQFKCVNT